MRKHDEVFSHVHLPKGMRPAPCGLLHPTGLEVSRSDYVNACAGLLGWIGDHLPTLLASSTPVHQYPDISIQHLTASLTNKLTLPSIGDVFLVCWRQSPSYGSKCSAGRGWQSSACAKRSTADESWCSGQILPKIAAVFFLVCPLACLAGFGINVAQVFCGLLVCCWSTGLETISC